MEDYKDNFVNGLEMAGFKFDVFECESGSLGFTVYQKGKDPANEDTKCVDIFVAPDLNVHSA